jgi:hypothetical protein
VPADSTPNNVKYTHKITVYCGALGSAGIISGAHMACVFQRRATMVLGLEILG